MTLNTLGIVYERVGQFEQAVATSRRALALCRALWGPDSPQTFLFIDNLAIALMTVGAYREAEQLHRESIAGFRRVVGPDDLAAAYSVNSLGRLLVYLGRYEEAAALLSANARTIRRVREDDPDNLLGTTEVLHARALVGLGRLVEANRLVEAVAAAEGRRGPGVLEVLGAVALARHRPAEAEEHFRQALEVRSTHPRGHWRRSESEGGLGESLAAQRRFADAEPHLRFSLQGYEAARHPQTSRARERLVSLYEAWGRPNQARRYRVGAASATQVGV